MVVGGFFFCVRGLTMCEKDRERKSGCRARICIMLKMCFPRDPYNEIIMREICPANDECVSIQNTAERQLPHRINVCFIIIHMDDNNNL